MKKIPLNRLRIPASGEGEEGEYRFAHLKDNRLDLNDREYIKLDFINHKHIVTKNGTQVYLARPSERRMKLIEAFSRKKILSRIVLNVECMTEDDAQDLLKKFAKLFNISVLDFKRVEFDQNTHFNKIEHTTVNPPHDTPKSVASLKNTNSYLSDQQSVQSTIDTIESLKSTNKVDTEVPDEIPYKRPSMGGEAALINSSGRNSYNDSASMSVNDVIPTVIRSKTSPTRKELDEFPSVPV